MSFRRKPESTGPGPESGIMGPGFRRDDNSYCEGNARLISDAVRVGAAELPQRLPPLDPRLAEKPVRAQAQHGEQQQIRGHRAEPAAEMRIEVPGADAFENADQHGADDRAGNAVETANDRDREDLEP